MTSGPVREAAHGPIEVAVVCGATGPLGLAVLEAMAAPGRFLVGVTSPNHDLEGLHALAPGARWERADLTDADEVEALWERIDTIGAPVTRLVNATGGFRGGTAAASKPDDLRFMLSLNLETAWWSSRAAGRRMAEAGRGAIVNVGSRAGIAAGPGAAAYAVSKAAVHTLTRVLAAELRGAGVRVNAVVPSVIDTPANRAWMSAADLARAVPPAAIAAVIDYLCGDEAAAITGAVLPVDGGS